MPSVLFDDGGWIADVFFTLEGYFYRYEVPEKSKYLGTCIKHLRQLSKLFGAHSLTAYYDFKYSFRALIANWPIYSQSA